jgi:hypothetical protein
MEIFGWQRYLSIENDFLNAQYYVSFDVQNAFSEFFTREVILLGAEIEAALKVLCKEIKPDETAGNMGEYKETILNAYPGIVNMVIRNRKTNVITKPFEGWDCGHLHWWDIYTHVKHGLVDCEATVKVATDMLQAYEVLLWSISAVRGSVGISFIEMPKLYAPLFASGLSVMGEAWFYLNYDRKSILEVLKGQNNGIGNT